MLNKSGIDTILRIIALGCSVMLMCNDGAAMEKILITVLICLCVFAMLCFTDGFAETTIYIVCMGIIILLGIVSLSPVFVIFLVQLVTAVNSSFGRILGIIMTVIYILLFIDDMYIATLDIILLSVGTIISLCINKIKYYKDMSLELRQHICSLKEKMQNNDKLVKSIRYAAILEERNRLAVRLHDKIGHNVSGSIIMLEAAMLNLDKNPDKAVEGINKAVVNLRTGVDDLRQALREERPVRSDINSNDIEVLLNEAKSKHDLNTFYYTEGNLERISMEMWECIKENTTELLTNTIIHSNGNRFVVKIRVMSSMVKVTYSDNGNANPLFIKGIGLEAVEERTRKCNGSCFFSAGETGFVTTTVYVV